jgi:hypothetical protein
MLALLQVITEVNPVLWVRCLELDKNPGSSYSSSRKGARRQSMGHARGGPAAYSLSGSVSWSCRVSYSCGRRGGQACSLATYIDSRQINPFTSWGYWGKGAMTVMLYWPDKEQGE